MEFFNSMNEYINTFLANAGVWEPLFSSLFIVLEGTFAFLPVFVFVTADFLLLGKFWGFIVSWICTVLGSTICFGLCRIGLSPLLRKFIKNPNTLKKSRDLINNISFSKLVLIISIPLTPSFFVNFTAGLSKIPTKKYLTALLFGKTCIILFWGVLGTSIVECLNNPIVLIKVVLMIVGVYLISKIINKKFNVDELFDGNE